MFTSGGTLHEQTPLGCPIEIYHPSAGVLAPHADTISVYRNGAYVELAVLSSTAVRSRTVPVRMDRPSASCDTELYTEDREVSGIAIEVEGLEVGDQFNETVVVDAAPCPTLITDYSSINWLQCSPPIEDYDRCCEQLGPRCGKEPPGSDGGGCASSRGAEPGAIALLVLAFARALRRQSCA